MDLLEQAVTDLDHPEALIRRHAVDALVRLQASAVSALQAILAHGNATARTNAVEALAQIGDGRTLPALRAGLSDPDPTVRRWCAVGLGRSGDVTSAHALRECCYDPSFPVAAAAVEALGEIGGDAGGILCELLDDPQLEPLRPEICLALGHAGSSPALDRLRLDLGHSEAEVRAAALSGLAASRDVASVPWVVGALKRSLSAVQELTDREARTEADTEWMRSCEAEQCRIAEVLGDLAEAEGIDVLVAALESGGVCVKTAAASALMRVAERHPYPELAAALPALHAQLPPWNFHTPEVSTAFRTAVQDITATLSAYRDLPLPGQGQAVDPKSLPRVP